MNGDAAHLALGCTPDALVIEIRSAGTDIETYGDVVGQHLIRFGERDELVVEWMRAQ